jgi:cation diffusion facilitator family transporter
MHIHNLGKWQHNHHFSIIHEKGERRTLLVLIITALTMVIEIAAGTLFGSMALLADGWHMGTHTAAFAITIFAYRYSKRHANNRDFTFGTGKVSVLGGFASAIALAVIALVMGLESIHRFFETPHIRFDEAISVAILGLLVNLLCAALLNAGHGGSHRHAHGAGGHDHNLKGAYLHVLADALTSVLAIVALSFGKFLGWHWLDPLMGIVGALIIARWSFNLLKDTSDILLDKNSASDRLMDIQSKIEGDADNRVSDIHLWKVGPADYAVIVSIVTHYPKSPAHYKFLLNEYKYLSHVTIEVNEGEGEPCLK